MATVLSSNFVHPPFNGLTQTEVVPVQGQNFFVSDRVEDPIRQLHLAPQQATVETMLAADRGSVDQAEPIDLFFVPGHNVRPDTGSFKTVQGVEKGLILPATCTAICENKQLSGIDPNTGRNWKTLFKFRHDLTNTVDQNIFVVDRCETLHTRRDLQPLIAILVSLDRRFRLL